MSFDHEFAQTLDVLYDNIFGMTALRYNISTKIPDGTGDEKIGWSLDWHGKETGKDFQNTGQFHIPKWEQKWRGGFFSCNGFDMTVPEGTVKDFGFDNVWKHLNSVHKESPLHLLIWGGDQVVRPSLKLIVRFTLISFLRISLSSKDGSIWSGIINGHMSSPTRSPVKLQNTISMHTRKAGKEMKSRLLWKAFQASCNGTTMTSSVSIDLAKLIF